MNEQVKETRRVVFDGEFYEADAFLTSLVKNANKQIFISDPAINSPLLKFLDNKKEGVEVIVACPVRTDTILRVNGLGNNIRIIPDYDVKDYYVSIDYKDAYIFGFPRGKDGEEFVAIIKLMNPHIGDIIVNEYNLKTA